MTLHYELTKAQHRRQQISVCDDSLRVFSQGASDDLEFLVKNSWVRAKPLASYSNYVAVGLCEECRRKLYGS